MLTVLQLKISQFHQTLFYQHDFNIWSVLTQIAQNKEETLDTFQGLGEQFLSAYDRSVVC